MKTALITGASSGIGSASARLLVDRGYRVFGPVDVLVDNAGESQSGPLEDLPVEAIHRLFQLNVLGPIRLTQLLTPAMLERGFGRVAMIGSMLGSFPLARIFFLAR